MIQKSTSLKYEPASEPLHIYVKEFFVEIATHLESLARIQVPLYLGIHGESKSPGIAHHHVPRDSLTSEYGT